VAKPYGTEHGDRASTLDAVLLIYAAARQPAGPG
jgi:hypothetical protein